MRSVIYSKGLAETTLRDSRNLRRKNLKVTEGMKPSDSPVGLIHELHLRQRHNELEKEGLKILPLLSTLPT
jgi:predicted nuclease with RNAse H fold